MNELDISKNWIILCIQDSDYIVSLYDFEAIPVESAVGVYQTGLYFGIPVYKSPHIKHNIACLNGKKTFFKIEGPIV